MPATKKKPAKKKGRRKKKLALPAFDAALDQTLNPIRCTQDHILLLGALVEKRRDRGGASAVLRSLIEEAAVREGIAS
jgi:hypothetical protein